MEDDDAFLYGSDEEQQYQNSIAPSTSTTIEAKDGDTLKSKSPDGRETDNSITAQTKSNESTDDQKQEEENSEGESDSESDSDSDIEFVIGSLESKQVNLEDEKISETTTSQETTVPILTKSNGLDVDKIGKCNDIPITQLSLDELKGKPWRLPGADISDYFNFGFDEISWLAYCSKVDKLRTDFNPGKVITELISSGSIPPTLAQILPGAAAQTNASGVPTPGPPMPMPPPFMMGPMPGFMGMPPGMGNMFKPGMNPSQGINNSNTGQPPVNPMMNMMGGNPMMMNSSGMGMNMPGLPNIPKLPSRPTTNTPEPPNSRLANISNSRDVRDQADKDLEKGNNQNNNYRERSTRRRR